MVIDSNGDMLIGTWNGLYVLSTDQNLGRVLFGNVPHHLMNSVVHSLALTTSPSIVLASHSFKQLSQLVLYDFGKSVYLTKLELNSNFS
jgi:ligand-binding sensor domain-containing protein